LERSDEETKFYYLDLSTELLMGEYKKSVKQKIVDAIKDLQVG
jgi:hypothetical protein